VKIRVYYEDTDIGGVVYHSNYLNFCERARSEAFFIKGLSPILETGHFVARKVEADYFSSAKLGDKLDVSAKLIEMKRASFKLLQVITLEDKKIFSLTITLAYIDFDGKPKRIEEDVKKMIVSIF